MTGIAHADRLVQQGWGVSRREAVLSGEEIGEKAGSLRYYSRRADCESGEQMAGNANLLQERIYR